MDNNLIQRNFYWNNNIVNDDKMMRASIFNIFGFLNDLNNYVANQYDKIDSLI